MIIDCVINHSAAANPLFVNSKSASSNAYGGWYLWQSLKPGGWSIYVKDPWRGTSGNCYFAPLWDQMPDFNLLNPRVVAYRKDNLRFWLNRGVDGFRFDAVGNLVENGPSRWENQPQNYPLLRDARALMNGYEQRFLVCEGSKNRAATPRPAAAPSRSATTATSWAQPGATAAASPPWPTASRPPLRACRRCWPTTTRLPATAYSTS